MKGTGRERERERERGERERASHFSKLLNQVLNGKVAVGNLFPLVFDEWNLTLLRPGHKLAVNILNEATSLTTFFDLVPPLKRIL